MITRKLLPCIFLVAGLWGCSPQWPHRYDTLAPTVPFRGFGKAVVVTRDARSTVTSGQIPPQAVGSVRSVAGAQWQIVTGSGNAFAQDISTAVCNTLTDRGFECLPLVSGRASEKDEIEYLQQTYSPVRILSVVIDEWNNEVLFSTVLRYDLSLKVFNPDGERMVSISTAGEDHLSGFSSLNPARYASAAAPRVLEKLLQSLLSHPQAVAALNMVRTIDALGARYR